MLREEYHRVWCDWYVQMPYAVRADRDIRPGDCSAGCSFCHNPLLLCICEGNLEDFRDWQNEAPSPGSRLGWPVNRRELIHEMLHEYQKKVVLNATAEGRVRHSTHGASFAGCGHDERFFSAIADRAGYFGVTADELVAELWPPTFPDSCQTAAESPVLVTLFTWNVKIAFSAERLTGVSAPATERRLVS